MKRSTGKSYLFLILFLATAAVAYGYRLIDPISGGRYGKASGDGPPFLKFGSTNQNYHIAASEYNNHTSAVTSTFTSWNNAGSVNFSSSPSSGLALETYFSSYGYPGIVNPGVAYTDDDNYVINTDNSYVQLNTFHDWGQVQDIQNHRFDVETILVHEVGHIHGLAHPYPGDYPHNASAPIMAGGDNEYFWDHTARSLRSDDINGTRFLQYNAWVPGQFTTIEDAMNNSFSGGTVHVGSGTYTEDIDMKPNVWVEGAGQNSTIINGKVNFNNDDDASLREVKVNKKISVINSDDVDIGIEAGTSICYVDISSSWAYVEMTSTVSGGRGIYAHNSSYFEFMGGEITHKSLGVDLYFDTDAFFEGVYFCQNTMDIYAGSGCYAETIDCAFSSRTEGESVEGDVYWEWWAWCGSMAKLILNEPKGLLSNPNTDVDSEGQDMVDYREASSLFHTTMRNIHDDRRSGKSVDLEAQTSAVEEVVGKFQRVITEYPASQYAASASGRIAMIWRVLGKYETLTGYMRGMANVPELRHMRPHALNALVSCHLKQGEYAEALALSDQIIDEFPEHDIVVELIYGKGVIYKYYLNDPDKAEEMFRLVVMKYPDHMTAESARDELQDSTQNSAEIQRPIALAVQNYPNPFNPITKIMYNLPERSYVQLRIYDLRGNEIRTLFRGNEDAGYRSVIWDGKDSGGNSVSSGMYFYSLNAISYESDKEFHQTRKMILLR